MFSNLFNLASDKKGHVTLGAFVGLALGNYPLAAAIAVFAVAVGKELYDYIYNAVTKTKTHGVEVGDAVATIVGGTGGILTVSFIKYLLQLFGV